MELSDSRPEWQIYVDEMVMLGHGVALWQPADRSSAQIGDVGFINSGQFVQLFNVLRSAEHPPNSDIMDGLEPFDGGSVVHKTPRRPGPLHGDKLVKTDGTPLDATDKVIIRPLTPRVPMTEAAIFAHILDPEPQALAQLCSTSDHGAALLTKTKTIREDTPHPLLFREYILQHRHTLLQRALTVEPTVTLDALFFVTGRDLTGDYATLAFKNNTEVLDISFTPEADVGSGPWGSWHMDPTMSDDESSKFIFSQMSKRPQASGSNKPVGTENSVFVRGYRVRERRIVANPPSPSSDEAARSPGDGPDNAPSDNARQIDFADPLDPLFNYIFSEHPDAQLAVVHDKDLRLLLRAEGRHLGDTVLTLVQRAKPTVDVNLDGVATLQLSDGSGTSNSAGPSRSPSIASRLASPVLRRARASTTSLASALFQPQTQRDELEKLVNKEVAGAGEFSTLPSSSSQTMEVHLGRTGARPSLTFSPSNPSELEPERGRARRVATPLSLSSSFPWFNRGKTETSVPRASASQTPMLPVDDLIQALTPPAVPLPQHARALAHALASEDTDVPPATLNPILSALCAVDSPPVLKNAGWHIMAACWHKAEPHSEKVQPMTSERLSHFCLIIQDQPWMKETWESRYKALLALLEIPSSVVGVEKELVQAIKTWIEGAFGRLVSGENISQEERTDRERAVETLSSLLMDIFANVEISSRLTEEDLGSLTDAFGSMIDRSLGMRPVLAYHQEPPHPPSRTQTTTTPTRIPYGHRRHPSSVAVPSASPITSARNPPLDFAIAVFVNFLSTPQYLIPLDRLPRTLSLLYRSLAYYTSPLPVPSVPSDAQLHQLSDQEKVVIKTLSSFLAGSLAASSIVHLKESLYPQIDTEESLVTAQLTSIGAFRTLRIHIRQVLRERLVQPTERPRATFLSMPDLGDDDLDAERTASAGWEPGRFGHVLRDSVKMWVQSHCDIGTLEPVLEEAAGILSDILHVFDARENDAMNTDEAVVIGETLQELAQYFRLLKLNAVPLTHPKEVPTPLGRSIASLLARGHASTPIQPPMTTILLSMADHLSDEDLAAIPSVMDERQCLSPTATDWLDNWALLLNTSAVYSRNRLHARSSVDVILRKVYDTVKDMPEYRAPLASLVLDSVKRQVDNTTGVISEVVWQLLSEEIVLRSAEVEDIVVQYDEEEETKVDNIDEHVNIIISFLEGVAFRSDAVQPPTPAGVDETPELPGLPSQSTVSSPILSRRQTEFTSLSKNTDNPSSLGFTPVARVDSSQISRTPTKEALGSTAEGTHSTSISAESCPTQATTALVTALGHLVFTSISSSHHNLVTAIRIYLVLLELSLRGHSPFARLTAWQFLLRLRADRDHRLFFDHNSHQRDEQTHTLATQIGRNSNATAPEPVEEKPRSTYRGRGATQSKATGSRSRSRAPRQDAPSSQPRPPRKDPIWHFPEKVPFEIADRPISNARLTSYDPIGPGRKVVLPISNYLVTLSDALLFERDWEILSYVACHLPSQLANKHLLCGPKCRQETKRLLDNICGTIQAGEFAQSIIHWPNGVTRGHATSLAYHTLSVLISYNRCFSLHQKNVLVEVFCRGLGAQPSTTVCCLQALSLAAFDLQPSMTRYLGNILDLLAQIMSNPAMPVHILNFVAIVGSIRSLHANFTREHFKKVFVVALKYLQDHNRRNTSLAGSWALSQHVRIMSYAVIYSWFLAVQLSDRADHITDITRGLLEANEGNPQIDEPTEVCFDWLARYTYGSADPRPAHSLLDEIVMNVRGQQGGPPPQIKEKTWLMGSSAIITIRTLPRHGWMEVIARRPSGLTKFLCKLENVPEVGPGDVDPDMLTLPGVLLMERDASEGVPTPLAGEESVEQATSDTTKESKPVLERPDPMTGYVWSGTAPSQRRKEVSLDPSFFALQLSPYPSNYIMARGMMVKDHSALARFLRNFDRLPVIDTHKVGVLYVAPGQTEQDEILGNTHGSPAYTRFLQGLGRLINLRGQKDVYAGGLDGDLDGEFAYAWWDDIGQILFHTATLMPTRENPADENRHRKLAHIGNDYVRIVWNDSGLPYNFETVRTQFQFVNIVIEAHSRGAVAAFSNNLHEHEYFKVTVQRAPGMADFLPIGDFKIISAETLPLLVRQLSLLSDWFSVVFLRTERDTRQEEVQTNWRERLRAIRRFAGTVRQQAEAAEAESEPLPTEGIMAQEALRDFSSSY